MAVDFHSTNYHRTLSAMDRGFPSLAAHSHVEGASTRTSGGGSGTHSMTDRPSSALARGVQITDYSETKVNPDPIMLEESEVLLEEYLSPRKLGNVKDKEHLKLRCLVQVDPDEQHEVTILSDIKRLLTGIENLEEVRYLEMKVDATETSLGNFGSLLPNLSQLKLSNSIIPSVRDLGSCLDHVRVLWMARCGLEELDGLSSLGSLKELYLAYNEIYDISPCSMLENLQILDLEGNNIDDISQVQFLNICSQLSNLTLEGNPVCVTPSPDQADPNYNYRQAVKSSIPQLTTLDDEPLSETSEPRTSASVFDEDWKMINELMQDIHIGSEEDLEDLPGTGIRPTTGYRPGSALRPQSAARRANTMTARPGSALRPGSVLRPGTSARPGTAQRPGTARPSSAEVEDYKDDASSELTVGGVVCGNPSKALRMRSRQMNTSVRTPPKLFSQFKHVPEHTYDTSMEDDVNMKELLDELKQWKEEHRGTLMRIQKSKAPQVLVVNHDDAVSLSGSDDESIPSDDDDDEDDDDADDDSGHDDDLHLRMMQQVQDYESTAAAATEGSRQSPSPRPPQQQSVSALKLRARKYKRLTSEEAHRIQKSNRLHTDESFDAPDDAGDLSMTASSSLSSSSSSVGAAAAGAYYGNKSQSTESLRPAPLVNMADIDTRPRSGPAADKVNRKFRLATNVNKDEPKDIDHSRPVIRVATYSPEKKQVPEGPRAFTAKAALAQPPPLRIRRQMPQVPSLPSRPNIPK